MIACACFRRAHRITSGKPGRPQASSWERELICGRRGWLSKSFISFDASKLQKSSVNCTNLSASHCRIASRRTSSDSGLLTLLYGVCCDTSQIASEMSTLKWPSGGAPRCVPIKRGRTMLIAPGRGSMGGAGFGYGRALQTHNIRRHQYSS